MTRNTRKFGLALTTLVVALLLSVFGAVSVRAATIDVPADHATIQAAIDNASVGDTINVAAGDYSEPVTIDKGLTLKSSVLHAAKIIGTVTIGGAHDDASNTVLDGFEIEGGVHIWDYDDVTVRYNKITASSSNGICYTHGSSSGGTVTHNVVSAPGEMGICLDHDGGTFIVTHNTVEARKAIMFGTLSGGVIECNTISSLSSDCDIEVWDASIVTAHYNNLLGEVWNSDSSSKPWTQGDTLDAKNNWWGDLDPSDQVSGDVDFCPWLDAAYPGGSATYPVVNATTGTGYCSIQAAIDAASDGHTINVAAGTYDENLSIQKPVDLIGGGATVTTITTSGSPEYLILIGNNSVPTFSQGMTVSGFTLVAPSLSGDKDLIGLRASGPNDADPIVIQNNVFNGSGGAIKGIETRSGGGTHDIVVENNEFNECMYGIWLNSAIDWRIEGNTIADSQWSGLAINTSDLDQTHDIDILENTILRTGVGTGYPEWSAGLHLGSTIYNVQVTGNTIADGYDHGVYVMNRGATVMTNVHINNNNIYNNVLGSVNELKTAGVVVDATNNWWGDPTGPYHPTSWIYDSQVITNPDGKGDEVSDYVLYDPWYRPITPMASFVVDHAKLDCKKKDGGKVHVKGELELDLVKGDGVDISEDVTVTVGPLSQTVPMVEKGKKGDKWEYKRPKDGEGEIKHMKIDWNKGTFDFEMDGLDLSELTRPVDVSVQIGDDFGQKTVLTSSITEVTIDSGKKNDGAKVGVKGELGFGRICGPYPFPSSGDVIKVSVGSLEPWTIDEQDIEVKGKEGESWEYKRPKGNTGEIKHMKIDWKKGTFDFDLDGVDLGSLDLSKEVDVSVTIQGITISETVSLTQKGKKDQWKTQAIVDQIQVAMSPNPIRDVHTATFRVMGSAGTEVEKMRVSIFDLAGRLVWEKEEAGSELDWHTEDLSGRALANGVYLYQVQMKLDGTWTTTDLGKIAILR
jgi:hypothetical protein